MPQRHQRSRLRRRPRAGFSLLEALIAVVILALGLLTHVSTTLSEHGMAKSQHVRSQIIQVSRDVLERLRADEDWPSLWMRLRYLEVMAESGGGPVTLEDGRTAWTIDTYFPSYTSPANGQEVHVLIESPPPHEPTGGGTPVFREDVTDTRFGLPSDLNGDGSIDATARDNDHLMLPVVVVMRWTAPGAPAAELRVPAWLRGER